MRTIFAILATSGLLAQAAPDSHALLDANHHAMGDWRGKATLTLDYAYSGQGMTGTTHTTLDAGRGLFVDSYAIGPDAGANGFDGHHVWLKEPSGTVTEQGGGDMIALAVNESYRDRNAWWAPDFGGAAIVVRGTRQDQGRSFDVVDVTPKGGKTFTAWFDAKTHLLDRIVEVQQSLTITTFYSGYAPVDGAMIARKQVVDDTTGVANRQTLTLTRAVFSPARGAAAYAAPAQDLHDASLPGGSTTVPFRLINNHIYADVSVNGSKPLLCLFDTGGHDILTPETARRLGVRIEGQSVTTGSGDNAAPSGNARVQSIRIGAAVITDQPVSIVQFANPAEGVDEQGMIGYEFFARFVTRIDYGRHTLTFMDPKSFDPKDAGTAVPFRFFQQFPEMLGTYDGIAGRFGVDSGARTALSLNRVFVQDNGLEGEARRAVRALTGWGVGGPSYANVTRGGRLTLGDLVVDHPLTEFVDDKGGSGGAAAFPNNVGGGVLKRFIVTLDYAHYRMFFKPIAGPLVDVDTFDRSGMWLNMGGGGFTIVDVTKGGAADRAGLKKGDVITAVDGRPASSIVLSDLRQELRDKPAGTIVRVTVTSAKGAHEAALSLRDQI